MTVGDLVYRCINADRWESGDAWAHLPRRTAPFPIGRWNDHWQFALYTSHEADTATAEKRRHLMALPVPTTVAGSLVAASTRRATGSMRVVVVSFDVPASHLPAFDVRGLGATRIAACLERCIYSEARKVFYWKVRIDGFVRLVSPSSPRPGTLNSVLYCGGWRQPDLAVLPTRGEVRPDPSIWIGPEAGVPCP